MSPANECSPVLFHQDGATCTTTRIVPEQGNGSTADRSARPLPSSIIGAVALHRLAAAGYRVTGVCRRCGAPLQDPVSVARGLGPVCAVRARRAS